MYFFVQEKAKGETKHKKLIKKEHENRKNTHKVLLPYFCTQPVSFSPYLHSLHGKTAVKTSNSKQFTFLIDYCLKLVTLYLTVIVIHMKS